MSTVYGEGRKAFYRLQEEIMKQDVDTSIFAWGIEIQQKPSSLLNPSYAAHDDHQDETFLLAPSPAAFRGCGGRHFSPPFRWQGHTHSHDSEHGLPLVSVCC